MTVSGYRTAMAVAALTLIVLPALTPKEQRASAATARYAVTDLGVLGLVQSAQASDINDAGDVVGTSVNHAFLWQNGVMTDLGTLGGRSSGAAAINALGQIAGGSMVSGSQTGHAVLWNHGTTIDLTPISGGSASGINDSRQVVGTANGTAFRWQNGVLTSLGHLGGGGSSGADINNVGHVVGTAYTNIITELGPMPHAFVWQNGVMTDLGVLPGDNESAASAINNLGQIVGSSGRTDPETYEITSKVFLHDGTVMTALPIPSSESYATDINDAGQIVGIMRAGGGFSKFHAYIYDGGVATNLNSLIPSGSGLHLAYAFAINNNGQIVGTAIDARAAYHAFLLTPVGANTPVVNIGDVSVMEGQTGTRSVSFPLTLSTSSNQPVTLSYSTSNGSATAGSDYQSAAGTVTFDSGQTTQTISVLINSDRAGEPNETFVVNLGQATAGTVIGDAQGAATIVDDEPRIAIDDVTKSEGNSGTTQFVFTVSLSAASDAAASVNLATENGSAKSGEDYDAKSGSLAFVAGETRKTFTVAVRGDKKREAQEVLYVNLSGAAGAFLGESQGVGVIRNDD